MKHYLVIVCIIMLVIGCGAKTMEEPPIEAQSSILHRDGSVVLCMMDGREIQLVGIKIPGYDDEKALEYRAMSRHVLHSLVTGKQLRLEYNVARTDTSSTSGYVYAGELLVNAEMIRRGYAYRTSQSSDGRFDAMFRSLEEEARMEKRGLWRFAPADMWISSES